MPMNVVTNEVSGIESNQAIFNGEVLDIDNNEVALAYFVYGQNSDLSDGVKSTRCALIDTPGLYNLIQDNMDDNKDYYVKAAVENYESTVSQLKHIENLTFFSNSIFNYPEIIESMGTGVISTTSLLKNKAIIDELFLSYPNYFKYLWDENKIKRIEENYFVIGYYDYSDSGSTIIPFNSQINFDEVSTIFVDSEKLMGNAARGHIRIDGKREFSFTNTRGVDSIDVSSLSGKHVVELEISERYKTVGEIGIYNFWLE